MSKKETYVVAVDSGKSATKTVAGKFDDVITSRERFYTRMEPTQEVSPSTSGSYIFEFNGDRVEIGRSESLDSTETTKALDVHKYCTYASIGVHGIPSGSDIILSVGCPLSEFTNTQNREKYIYYILGLDENASVDLSNLNLEISFKLNNKELKYTIKEFHVYPETTGATNYEYLLEALGTFAVVDIGGLNVNGAIFEENMDGIPEITKAVTLEYGGNMFLKDLSQQIFQKYGLSLNQQALLRSLDRGSLLLSGKEVVEGSVEFLHAEKTKYLQRIINGLRGRQWDLKAYPYVFIGGASQIFQDVIVKVDGWKEATFSQEPIWENVEGFGYLSGLVEYEEEAVDAEETVEA